MSDIFSRGALSGYGFLPALLVLLFVRSPAMLDICKETTDFVRACEAIHDLLERGDTLASEDRDLIEFSGVTC
jgi:hypothetical protein